MHTIWEIACQTPLLSLWYKEHIWGNPLRVELYWLPFTWLFLGGVLLTLVASLCRVGETEQPVTQYHKYGTIVLSLLSLFVSSWAIVHSVQIAGMIFPYAPAWLRIVADAACCVALVYSILSRKSNITKEFAFSDLDRLRSYCVGLGITTRFGYCLFGNRSYFRDPYTCFLQLVALSCTNGTFMLL